MAASAEWYYNVDDDETVGPMEVSELKVLWKQNQIDGHTLAWAEHLEGWEEINNLPNLKALIKPKPKPRPKPGPKPKRKRKLPPKAPSQKQSMARKAASFKRAHSWRDGANVISQPQDSDDTDDEEVLAPYNPSATFTPEKSKTLRKRQSSAKKKSPRGKDWEERKTLEGISYYYSPSQEALTWDKPKCLQTSKEREVEAIDWCWVQSGEGGWDAARQVKTKNNGAVVCEVERTGSRITVPKKDVDNLWTFAPSELTRLEQDIVMLDHINEAQITNNLSRRYAQDKIYTWVGASKTVLISINPFKWLPLYTPAMIKQHRHPPPNKTLEPHVFDIANHALDAMQLNSKNQAILISGESGAGKTECAKQCFSFLAEAAGSSTQSTDDAVEQKILMANPLLEAFGNAKTLRNNNSSRFGKWVEIQFDEYGCIAGARAENYLLEKSRVVKQAKGERNYHVFYQLMSSSRFSSRYGLSKGPSGFRYLKHSGCSTADGIDDAKEMEEMQAAMSELGFTREQQTWVFDVTAGVLWLGNMKFKTTRVGGVEGSKVSSPKALKQVAKFLGVNSDALAKGLTFRSIEIGGKKTMIPLKPADAFDACDALAKSVYGHLFDWLVQRVNAATACREGGNTKHFIGVLDIFGFEIFENNSFEQLCINYCNEKLQQHFNKSTFKDEESVYIREKVKYTKVPFIDNQPVIDLIENHKMRKVKGYTIPQGLLLWLDDEVRVPKGSDDGYVKHIDKCFALGRKSGGSDCYSSAKKLRREYKNQSLFTVKHYAGDVTYSCKGFVVKNKDTLYDDLYRVMSASQSPYMNELFKSKKSRSRKQQTLSERFRKQLKNLMKLLKSTEPAYIRCVKPNHTKREDEFEPATCIEQLRYSGVFEAVQIRKSGYPFRLTHKQFASRYRCTLLRSDGNWQPLRAKAPQWRKVCEEMLKSMRGDVSDVAVGESMVLYRAGEHRLMELMRHLCLSRIVPACQRVMRGYLAREMARRLRRAESGLLIALEKRNDIEALAAAIKASTTIIGSMVNIFDFKPKSLETAISLERKLREWVKLQKQMESLENSDVESNYDKIALCVSRGTALLNQDIPATSKQKKLLKLHKQNLHVCASARLNPEAEEALYVLDKKRMEDVLAEADKAAYTSDDLKKIRELLALDESAFVKLQLKKAIELDDPVRKANREIWITNNFLKKNEDWLQLKDYHLLRHPEEFASASWLIWKREELAASMLKHTVDKIPTSLTKLNPGLISDARLSFKNVLGYMGDRKYSGDGALVSELIQRLLDQWHGVGEFGPGQQDGRGEKKDRGKLAAEVYVQVMKQLSGNPSPESERKGWKLMAVLTRYVDPGPCSNYLMVFLRQHSPGPSNEDRKTQGNAFISALHELKYGEMKTRGPEAIDIDRQANKVMRRKLRSRWSCAQKIDISSIQQLHSQKSAEQRHKLKSMGSHNEESDEAPEEQLAEKYEEAPDSSDEESVSVEEEASSNDTGDTQVMACAEYDFEAMDDSMLNMMEGDKFIVLDQSDDGWWHVRAISSGDSGYVPGNYLALM